MHTCATRRRPGPRAGARIETARFQLAPGGLTSAEYEAHRFGNARPRNRFEGDRFVTDVVYHRNLGSSGSVEGFVHFSETERNLDAQRPHFDAPTSLMRWTDTSCFVGVGGRVEKPFTLAGIENTAYAGFRYRREWLPNVVGSDRVAGWESDESRFAVLPSADGRLGINPGRSMVPWV